MQRKDCLIQDDDEYSLYTERQTVNPDDITIKSSHIRPRNAFCSNWSNKEKKKKTDKEKQNKKVTNSKEKPFKCDVAYGKGYRVQKPMPSPCFPCMLACNPAISFQPLYFSLHRNSYPFSCRKFNPASRSA